LFNQTVFASCPFEESPVFTDGHYVGNYSLTL